jgi:PAS domain S-box-containing protein
MRLRKRAVVTTSIFFGLAIIALFGIISYILWYHFTDLEHAFVQKTVGQMRVWAESYVENLDVTAADWANWTGLYRYMHDGNPEFAESNLVDVALDELGLDIMLLVRPSGSLAYGRVSKADGAGYSGVTAQQLKEFARAGVFDAFAEKSEGRLGMVALPGHPAILVARPILTSERTGPARGILVMGCFLDDEQLQHLSLKVGAQTTLYPIVDRAMPDDMQKARNTLLTGVTSYVNPLPDRDHIAGYCLLHDWHGKPAFLARVLMDRPVNAKAVATISLLALVVLTTLVLLAVVSTTVQEKTVLERLHLVSKALQHIGATSDISTRVEVSGSDELSELGTAINSMLEALEQSEYELRENERRLKAILDSLPTGVLIVDVAHQQINHVNIAATSLIGLPKETLIGSRCEEYFAPSCPDGATGGLFDGPSGCHVGHLLQQGGGTVPVLLQTMTMPIGGRRHYILSFIDISDRIRAEEILRQSRDELEIKVQERTAELQRVNESLLSEIAERKRIEAKVESHALFLQQLLDTIPVPVFYNDVNGVFQGCNAPYTELMGRQSGEVIGHTVFEILPAEQAAQSRETDLTLLEQSGVQSYETTLQAASGEWRNVVVYKTAYRLADGTVGGVIGAIFDITERKQMEVQLRQAQKLESVGQQAAGIAHEINTPTQFVGDNIQFLQDAVGDIFAVLDAYASLKTACREGAVTPELIEAVDEAIERADLEYLQEDMPRAIEQSMEGVQRVAKIVRAMKEFSHPDSGEKAQTDLNKAIESTVTVARNEWKYVADLVTDFDPSLPLVMCVPGDFNQVMLNLIVNASHAIAEMMGKDGEQKGTITIRTRKEGDWAEIRVQDTGTGIPEEARSRIFDPFFTTKEVGKGTGQGLAISYNVIANKHGGTISFDTELGRGTTFIVRLPISPESLG